MVEHSYLFSTSARASASMSHTLPLTLHSWHVLVHVYGTLLANACAQEELAC
jgi:hypothetical protein